MSVIMSDRVLEAIRHDHMRARMDRIRQIMGISKGRPFLPPLNPTAKQQALIKEYRRLEARGGIPTGGNGRKPSIRTLSYDGTFALADSIKSGAA